MDVTIEKVRSFGGQIDALAATSVIAIFGLEPLEDVARYAASAAMAIQKVAARAHDEDPGSPTVGVAIHTARVLVGRHSGGRTVDSDAKRAPLAALETLGDHAGPGTVMVSAAAAPFLTRCFELAADVSPSAGPIYRLVGAAGHDRGLATAFVGREAELGLLRERLRHVEGGQGQMVSVVGEPGIGKSRLLRELRRQVGEGAAWMEGQSIAFGRTMAFHPLIDLVRRAFLVDDGDPEAAIVEKIEHAVLPLGEDLRPVLPFLRYLLSVDPGDPGVLQLSPQLRRDGDLPRDAPRLRADRGGSTADRRVGGSPLGGPGDGGIRRVPGRRSHGAPDPHDRDQPTRVHVTGSQPRVPRPARPHRAVAARESGDGQWTPVGGRAPAGARDAAPAPRRGQPLLPGGAPPLVSGDRGDPTRGRRGAPGGESRRSPPPRYGRGRDPDTHRATERGCPRGARRGGGRRPGVPATGRRSARGLPGGKRASPRRSPGRRPDSREDALSGAGVHVQACSDAGGGLRGAPARPADGPPPGRRSRPRDAPRRAARGALRGPRAPLLEGRGVAEGARLLPDGREEGRAGLRDSRGARPLQSGARGGRAHGRVGGRKNGHRDSPGEVDAPLRRERVRARAGRGRAGGGAGASSRRSAARSQGAVRGSAWAAMWAARSGRAP